MTGLVPPASAQPTTPPPKPPIVLEADEIRARPDVDAVAEGSARFTQDKLEIRADRLSYEQAGDLARGTGHVQVFRDGNRYSGTELQVQVQRFEGYFLSPTYFFSRTQAGGTAQRIDFLGEDVAVATGGTYTSCPRDGSGDPAWLLSTDRVKLDFANNEGIAEGAVLRFYGVPILAAPTLSFPLTDARKSGWLPPSAGLDNKSGLQLSMPYYWNIAPNRDATLTPVVIAKRGVGLNTEFRYLQPRDEGKLNLNLLANDRLTGESRGSLGLLHDGQFGNGGFYKASVARVSDDDYWKDFSRDFPGLTPRLLAADVAAGKDFGDWSAYARVLRWQVLQDVTNPITESPYDRYLQIGVRGLQRLPGGFEFGLETEYNRFTNPDGNIDPTRRTGARAHALGSLSWPHVTPGWTLAPKVSLNTAAYDVDPALTAGQFTDRTRFSRSVPSVSVDSAWVLERDSEWFGKAMRQTLEPRLLYVRTPYREQLHLPNFDSAEKDFNFDSIYTDNIFSGIDRVSDANQMTAGVTTRVVDAQTGSEALRLGIAQRFLFADQRVTANDGPPLTQHVSDILLLGSTNFWPKWKLDAGLQYNPDNHQTMRSVMGVHYSPGAYRTLNFAYRLKRDESEQVELGWQWPIYGAVRDPSHGRLVTGNTCSGTWYSVGRVNYSLRDSRVTDSVLGVEYDAGCWIGRLVAKRLSTNQQEATTQLGFEIEFIGLSRLGTNPLKVLKDNIPGYRLLRDNDPASTASPLNTP